MVKKTYNPTSIPQQFSLTLNVKLNTGKDNCGAKTIQLHLQLGCKEFWEGIIFVSGHLHAEDKGAPNHPFLAFR